VTDSRGEILMPCGRCRQLLFEHGGAELLVDHAEGPKRLSELLPYAFGPDDLAAGRTGKGPSPLI
jgi:cytidine deaminase